MADRPETSLKGINSKSHHLLSFLKPVGHFKSFKIFVTEPVVMHYSFLPMFISAHSRRPSHILFFFFLCAGPMHSIQIGAVV